MGVEPTTCGLQSRCAAIAPRQQDPGSFSRVRRGKPGKPVPPQNIRRFACAADENSMYGGVLRKENNNCRPTQNRLVRGEAPNLMQNPAYIGPKYRASHADPSPFDCMWTRIAKGKRRLHEQPEKLLPLKVFQAQDIEGDAGNGLGVPFIADESRFRKLDMYLESDIHARYFGYSIMRVWICTRHGRHSYKRPPRVLITETRPTTIRPYDLSGYLFRHRMKLSFHYSSI